MNFDFNIMTVLAQAINTAILIAIIFLIFYLLKFFNNLNQLMKKIESMEENLKALNKKIDRK
jgi:H+/gluconate symporter-like permease